jgi:pimeloyl-ACP methyl ester carboxylesterase
MLTEKTFDTGEVVINYAESDTNGPPMVMLHGVTLNWQTLGELIPTFEKDWHVYACDYRGHGKSGRATSGYRAIDFVRDVVVFIKCVIGQPTVVLGWSMGATVALDVAAQLPKLTRAIVSLEPGLILWHAGIQSVANVYGSVMRDYEIMSSSRTTEEMIANIKRLLPEVDEAGVQFTLDRINGLDPAVLTTLLSDRTVEDFDLEAALRQVVCPTLLVYGEAALGGLVQDRDAALFKSYVPHANVVQVREIGHDICWGPSGTVTLEHVTKFLASL